MTTRAPADHPFLALPLPSMLAAGARRLQAAGSRLLRLSAPPQSRAAHAPASPPCARRLKPPPPPLPSPRPAAPTSAPARRPAAPGPMPAGSATGSLLQTMFALIVVLALLAAWPGS
jgi:flagellar protein FliO/FliZ